MPSTHFLYGQNESPVISIALFIFATESGFAGAARLDSPLPPYQIRTVNVAARDDWMTRSVAGFHLCHGRVGPQDMPATGGWPSQCD